MKQMIAAAIDADVRPVEDAGLDGDMLEAQAFAYLAMRVAVCGGLWRDAIHTRS